VTDVCRGKTLLNFDDAAFGPGLHRYLAQQFPAPTATNAPTRLPFRPRPLRNARPFGNGPEIGTRKGPKPSENATNGTRWFGTLTSSAT
jgi:hypothetical protein